jgi:hypothetical protein
MLCRQQCLQSSCPRLLFELSPGGLHGERWPDFMGKTGFRVTLNLLSMTSAITFQTSSGAFSSTLSWEYRELQNCCRDRILFIHKEE